MNEKIVSASLVRTLRRRGYNAMTSVLIPPAEIDIVAFDRRNVRIFAIEVKLFDWRKAIEQARRNLLFAHYSAVAVPAQTAEKIPSELLEGFGLGLFAATKTAGQLSWRVLRQAELSNDRNLCFSHGLMQKFTQRSQDFVRNIARQR